jgi:hypothetical protein
MRFRMIALLGLLALASACTTGSPTAPETTPPEQARFEGTGYMGSGK